MQDAPYRLIPLHSRKSGVVGHALVSPEDYERLVKWRWHVSKGGYAARGLSRRQGGGTVAMHREVLGLVRGDGLEGDHENRDRLDNRRSNLRVIPHVENARNRGSNRGASSRYRGVTWDRSREKWSARATVNGHLNNLGRFVNERDAARAVNAFWIERGYPAPNEN